MDNLKITCLILFFAFNICTGQTDSLPNIIHIKDFNWTVKIPDNLTSVNKDEWNKLQERGKNAIEDTFGEEIINYATTIFLYENGQFNKFEAVHQPHDVETDGDYLESYKAVNEIIYITLQTQMPQAKLDSISSTQNISGLEFRKFEVKIDFPNGMKMKMIGYSRLFDQRELAVNIIAIDEKIAKQMMDAFLNSKFE